MTEPSKSLPLWPECSCWTPRGSHQEVVPFHSSCTACGAEHGLTPHIWLMVITFQASISVLMPNHTQQTWAPGLPVSASPWHAGRHRSGSVKATEVRVLWLSPVPTVLSHLYSMDTGSAGVVGQEEAGVGLFAFPEALATPSERKGALGERRGVTHTMWYPGRGVPGHMQCH